MREVWEKQLIPGLYLVGMEANLDSRGAFHKILMRVPPEIAPLEFKEIFWSVSNAGVARGMHFQVPPHHGRKLVFATSGAVLDLVVDLRVGSPTYKQSWKQHLTPQSKGVLIPAGCAHGFFVTHSPAVLVYAQEGDYHKECDTGVKLESLHFTVEMGKSELSERDHSLPELEDFISPFTFDPEMFDGWVEERRD